MLITEPNLYFFFTLKTNKFALPRKSYRTDGGASFERLPLDGYLAHFHERLTRRASTTLSLAYLNVAYGVSVVCHRLLKFK